MRAERSVLMPRVPIAPWWLASPAPELALGAVRADGQELRTRSDELPGACPSQMPIWGSERSAPLGGPLLLQ